MKKSTTNITGRGIEFQTFGVSPSWKHGGDGITHLQIHRDGPAGLSISATEYDKETNRSRQTIISLDAEQTRHLLEYLAKLADEPQKKPEPEPLNLDLEHLSKVIPVEGLPDGKIMILGARPK